MSAELVVMGGMNDGLRAYVRERRRWRNLTQEQLAEKIGMSLRAYTDWERGKRPTIKSTLLTQIVEALGAAPEHVAELLSRSVPPERARELARIDRIIAETSPEELDRIVADLRARAEREPALIVILRALLGRSSASHDGHQSH